MLSFSYLEVLSQYGFNFEYGDAYSNHAFDLIQSSDSSFLILSGRADFFSNTYKNAKLLKISDKGKLKYSSEIITPGSISQLSRLHRYPGLADEFMAVGTITPGNNPNKSFILIVHFDKQLKQIAQYQAHLPLNIEIQIHKSICDSYGNIIVSGSYLDGISAWSLSIFMARISLSGKVLDFEILPLPLPPFVNDIIQLKSNTLQYGINVTGQVPGSSSIESFLVFDSLLNYQSVYPIPFITGWGNVTVVNYEQMGYVFSGKKDNYGRFWQNTVFYGFKKVIDLDFPSGRFNSQMRRDYAVVKTDLNINAVQSVVFGSGNNMVDFPAHKRATNYLNPTSLFNTGTINIKPGEYPFQQDPSWILINKMGADLGLIWQRYYGGNAYYHATNINATTDGGCIVSGFKFDYASGDYNYNLFVIKSTPDGVLTAIENPDGIHAREVILYPNPGTSELNIQTGHDNLYIKLYDARGKLRYEGKIKQFHHSINTVGWSAGIYMYQVTKGKEVIEQGKWMKGK